MQNKDYYLYKHTNLINGKCYIGITCQTPEQRWRSGLGYKDQSKFYGAILKYGWNSFSHEILYKNLSQEEAYNLEKKLIVEYDSIENGYNIQQGGEDVGIWAREHLGATIYKLDPTDFHIIYQYDSISNASRELSVSPTAIANAIQVRGECLGYYWCKEDEYDDSWKPRIKENLKAIYMIDRNTFEIIKEYDSIISATKETGISYSGLRRCDEFYSLGGFCWCKKENWYKGWKPKRKPNTATPVFQIEPNSLKVLNEWPSIIEASKALGINKNTIIRCCQNKGILAGNFHWCKIENWSQNWKPKEETLRTPPRKKVYQIDIPSLTILSVFESASAADSFLGLPSGCVAKAASGRGTKSGGYYWCYVDDYENWRPKVKKKTGPAGRPVLQFSINDDFIREWSSVKEAALELGISPASLSNACAGRTSTAKGYIWRYKKDSK